MNDEKVLRLLDRYVSDLATPSEREYVEAWMAADASHQALVRSLQEAWKHGLGAEHRWDAREAYLRGVQRRVQKISDRTASSSTDSVVSHGRDSLAGRFRWAKSPMLTVCAAMALMAIVVVAGWSTLRQPTTTGHISPNLVYSTANGQRATVTLPDGSQILLNVASRLEVPVNFGADNQVLYLSGEALFRVVHQSSRPLTVVSGLSVTRVLGTQFIVRHYPSDTSAVVVVRDGKVAVRDVVLTATQQLEVFRDQSTQLGRGDPGRFSFADGVLTLPGVPLLNAIDELNRWYDADIRLGDRSLADQYIKGTFVAGSLADLTDLLELTFNVRVVRNGRTLTLYSKA